MAERSFIKRRMRVVQHLLLRIFFFAAALLPRAAGGAFARCLGRLAYVCAGKARRRALASVAVAFPAMTEDERKHIARDFFCRLARLPFDVVYYLRRPAALGSIEIAGIEHLRAAHARGKGVIAVSAHMGNFPLMHMVLARAGFPVSVMARPMRDEASGAFFHRLRGEYGITTIYSLPRTAAVRDTLASLNRGGVVIIQMDQDFKDKGMLLEFFGRAASTPVGPVVLAMRARAALVPVYMAELPDGRHRVNVLPEIPLGYDVGGDEPVRFAAQRFNRLLEQWIKEYPSQWGWFHERWKSAPA